MNFHTKLIVMNLKLIIRELNYKKITYVSLTQKIKINNYKMKKNYKKILTKKWNPEFKL